MANPEIANLWNEYLLIQEEFKQAHKGHIESSKETSHLKELRNDINAIEMEKANGTALSYQPKTVSLLI